VEKINMACDVLDLRCIFVNELIGDPTLALLLIAVLYFVVVAKLKFGFETSVYLMAPLMLMFGLVLGGFSVLYAFLTLIAGFLLAEFITKLMARA